MATPPAPLMTPKKVPAGFDPSAPAAPAVIVRVWPPSTTEPLALPESVVMEAPAVVPEMSNVPPLSINTMLDVATLPLPNSARVALPPAGLGMIAVMPV
jgi:hypothetical protein